MSKNKSKTKADQSYSNTAQYKWENTPDTPDTAAYRNYKPEVDPSIAFGAAADRNRLNSSFINPLGGYMTPSMKDKLLAAGNNQISQNASQAFRQGQYDVNQQRGGQLASLAALTAPRLVQSGSEGKSNGVSDTTQGKNLFGNVMDVAQAASGIALG